VEKGKGCGEEKKLFRDALKQFFYCRNNSSLTDTYYQNGGNRAGKESMEQQNFLTQQGLMVKYLHGL